jgi:uncharacterized membrane protein
MKRMFGFLASRIAAGFVLLLPVVLVLLVLAQLVTTVVDLVAPITELLPVDSLGGVGIATIVAILLVLAVLFIAGLLLRSRAGQVLFQAFERRALAPLPGYPLVKSLTQRFAGESMDKRFAPAAVTLAEGLETVGFIVEQHEDGSYTVMVPIAPTPTLGNVYHLHGDRVREVEVPMTYAVNAVMQWGIDSRKLFERT